jgi:hypothetical protein
MYTMYNHLENSQNVLITGCGGGYDIFCGLDLAFNLIEQNKKVVLGNYSFTKNEILFDTGELITNCCVKLTHQSYFDNVAYVNEVIADVNRLPESFFKCVRSTKTDYIQNLINPNMPIGKHECFFPEYKLVKNLHEMYGLSVPLYCFVGSGIKHLTDAYNKIIDLENIDTIILMDGGTDSLMTGKEYDENGNPLLGTPFEDISSIVAIHNTNVERKYLYCLGFNIDKYHNVTDENFLKNTCELIKQNGFIGSYMLSKHNLSTQMYIDLFIKSDPENSIVNSLIISAINGYYGNHTPEWLKHRIGNTVQHIHPFMALYWIYSLGKIHDNLTYNTNMLKETEDECEISKLLQCE